MATFWILKTVIHTGCIIFPLSVTCFDNFYWVDIDYIRADEDVSVSYSNSYYFDEPFISWVETYFENPFNRSIVFNFLISLGLLIILNLKIKNEAVM